MAPLRLPSASEIAVRFSKWDAEHTAIKSEYEAEEKRQSRLFDEAKKEIDGKIDREKQPFAGSQPVHPSLLKYFEETRTTLLNKLRRSYETGKAEREQAHEQKLLDHLEAYGAFIGLAGLTISDSVKQALPAKEVKETRQPRNPLPQEPTKKSSPRQAAERHPLSSATNAQFESASILVRDGRHVYSNTDQTGLPPQTSKLASLVAGHRDNQEGVEKIAHAQREEASNGTTAKIFSERPRTPNSGIMPFHPHNVPLTNTANGANSPNVATKRKADSSSPPRTSTKKSKVDANILGSSTEQSPKKPATKRSISFDEVYQDGNAEYKHTIIEYPPGENNWYILKCDEHGVHFNLNPLHGAAKHLAGSQHGHQSKEHSLAVSTLGHLVFDCDVEMAKRNNAAMAKAFAEGYKPFNRNHLSKSMRASMGFPVTESPKGRKKLAGEATNGGSAGNSFSSSTATAAAKSFQGITNPVAGELYRGYWSKNKTKYAVMLLPWGNLAPAGMLGSLVNTGLLVRAPRCYLVDRMTQEIKGWAAGYEDGGEQVTRREFPVMYFDGARSVGWLRAKDLSFFDMEDPEAILIPNFDLARDHYARAHGFDNYAAMKLRRQELGLPEKRLSDVGQLSAESLAVTSTVETDGLAGTPQDTTEPGQIDGHSTTGAGKESDDVLKRKKFARSLVEEDNASTDVEMRDTPIREDDTESYRESESDHRDWTENDDDVEMANSDSRRTSVSATAPAREARGDAAAAAANNAGKDRMAGQAQDKQTTATHISQQSANPAPKTRLSQAQTLSEDVGGQQNGTPTTGKASNSPSGVPTNTAQVPASFSSIGMGKINGGDASTAQNRPLAPAADIRSSGEPHKPGQNPYHLDTNNTRQHVPGAQPVPKGASAASGINAQGNFKQPQQVPTRAASADVARRSPLANQQREPSVARSEGMPARQTSQEIQRGFGLANATGYQTFAASKTSPGGSSGAQARSPSSTPAPASKPTSRASTPISVVRPDDVAQMSRWRAVRSESAAPAHSRQSSPSSTNQAIPPGRTATSEPRKETPAAQSNRSASPMQQNAAAGRFKSPFVAGPKVELFELATYEDNRGNSFHKQKDGTHLRLAVDAPTKTAEASIEGGPTIKIEPMNVVQMVVEPLGDSGTAACRVTLTAKEGSGDSKEQKLVFEATKAMGREESGRIHARRFCRWATSVNVEISYRNKSFDSNNLNR